MTKACKLADELEAIDTRLRAVPTQNECSAAVNDLLRFMDKAAPAILTALRSPPPTREAVLEEAARIAEQYVSFPQPTSRAAQWWEREVTRHTIASKIRALSPNPEPIVGRGGEEG